MSPRPTAIAWTIIAAGWLALVVLAMIHGDVAGVCVAVAGLSCAFFAITENRNKTAQIHTLRTHIRILEAKHHRENQRRT